MSSHPLSLKYKSIIKKNLNLKVFTQEIIYLKQRIGLIFNLDE